jgi:hypothetical protein
LALRYVHAATPDLAKQVLAYGSEIRASAREGAEKPLFSLALGKAEVGSSILPNSTILARARSQIRRKARANPPTNPLHRPLHRKGAPG